MIDLIRFILIIAAVLVFIYLSWHSYQEGMSDDNSSNDNENKKNDNSLNISHSVLTDEISSPERIVGKKSKDFSATDTDISHLKYNSDSNLSLLSPTTQDYTDSFDERHTIIFKLKANKGSTFNGSKVLELLQKNNLEPGPKQIFYLYHFNEEIKRKYIVFSICNARDPGTLTLDELPNLQTDQLFFFMDFVQAESPVSFFDKMIKISKNFEKELHGKLYTKDNRYLVNNIINNERQKIQRYVQKRFISQITGPFNSLN